VRLDPAVAHGRNRARRSTNILLSCLDLVRSWRALSTAVVIFQRGERRGDVGIGGGGATEVNYAIYHNYIM